MDFELRKWRPEDAWDVCKHANNKKIADNLRDAFPWPYSLSDAQAFCRKFSENDESRQCCRAIVLGGEVIGSVGVFLKDDVYRKSGEIGYWLGEDFWGRGIMSEAVGRLCGFVFEHYDVVRIYAEVYAHNRASQRTLEKAGFVLEGILRKSVYKNGAFFDACLYALIREP